MPEQQDIYSKRKLIIEFLIDFLNKKKKKEHTHHEYCRFYKIVHILLKHHFGILEWQGDAKQFCKFIIHFKTSGLIKHSSSIDVGKYAEILQMFMAFYRTDGKRIPLSPTGLKTTMYRIQSMLNSSKLAY